MLTGEINALWAIILFNALRHLGQCAKRKCKYGILVDDVHDVTFPRFRLELRYIEGVIQG
jgi:hypothetical protein